MTRYGSSGLSLGALCAIFALHSHAAPVELDPAFGIGGIASVAIDPGGNDEAQAIAIDNNGNIVAVGTASNAFSVARFTASGSPDTDFAPSGFILNDITARPDGAYAVDIDADNNIIAAGRSNTGLNLSDFTMVRYTPAGQPDTTFGNNGIVTTTLSSAATPYAIGRDSNQRIILGGGAAGGNFALAAYSAAGTLDTSFASSGYVVSGVGHTIRALAIDSSNRIVVGGFTSNTTAADFIIARFLSDGSLDTSFGSGGVVVSDLGAKDQIYALTLDSDGNVVVAGNSGGALAIARYTTAGSLDTTFGTNGWTTVDASAAFDIAYDVEIDAQGNIVVAGLGGPNYLLARLDSSGSPDASFDEDGYLVFDLTGTGQQDQAFGLAIDSNGGYLLGGRKYDTTSRYDLTIARFQLGNSVPMANSVAVAGVAQVGSTLTGSYEYFDAETDLEGDSQFMWMSDTDVSGTTRSPILGANALGYVPQIADAGNFLFFCVSPIALSGSVTGDQVCSSATSAVLEDDNDGLDGTIENSVSDPDGSGSGDGNGDTVPDNQQGDVASLLQFDGAEYATLVSLGNLQLAPVSAIPAPVSLPASASFPVGAFSFTATGAAPGAREDFALYIPFNPAVTMALKRNRLTGEWVDVADSIIQVGNKTRISFSVTNGGPFDADENATNDQIQDPVVPATGALVSTVAIPTLNLLGLGMLIGMLGMICVACQRKTMKLRS